MDIKNIKGTVFFVGIKGVAMANLAVILKKLGAHVTGSDTNETFITDELLSAHNIPVVHTFEPEAVPADCAMLVYSAAHGGSENKQVRIVRERSIEVLHQAELIGRIGEGFEKVIAVCGSHGKTTTSAMLAYALKQLGAPIAWMVGTSGFSGMEAGGYDGHEYFVLEADEYALDPPRDNRAKFLFFEPSAAIATNIDFDHPDVYADVEATEAVFRQFFDGVAEVENGVLFLNADDERLMKITQVLPDDAFFTYGYAENSTLRIVHESIGPDGTSCELTYKGEPIGSFSFLMFGGSHVRNAAGVILCLLHYGFPADAIRGAITGFTGAKRRFELVHKQDETYLFDDYAHHPAEIRATIKTARKRFPGRRIVLVFQPHTYSRTQSLEHEFIDAFKQADAVFLAPVFPSAREKTPAHPLTSEELAKRAGETVHSVSHISGIGRALTEFIKPGDIIFTMGAGDIYKAKHAIIELISSPKP